MAIIVILIGAVITVGRAQTDKARERETAGVLETLNLVARQFADEKPHPLRRVRGYRTRYGLYPPDELDGFAAGDDVGIPGTTDSKISQHLLNIDKDGLKTVDHGDIKAFVLAVRLYSQTGGAMLEDIQAKYRHAAHKDADGNPDEFLNRDGNTTFDPAVDEPLDYLVDAWGTPIAYFATRPSDDYSVWDNDTVNVQTEGDRRRTCGALLSLSNDVPVFVSYGPDGPEQFSQDFIDANEGHVPDLIYDFGQDVPEYTFDHPLNRDNVYSNETVRDKILVTQIPEGEPI